MNALPRVLLAAVCLALPARAQDPADGSTADPTTVIVHLADGSSLPLRGWSLFYEYVASKEGASQFRLSPLRRQTGELWVGKKSYPVKGQTLELSFRPELRDVERDGQPRRVQVKIASGMTLLGATGKREALKPEPPHRDLLMPDAEKGTLLTVRSLDLSGETLAGTRREFCLLSFTPQVECPFEPAQQVVKAEFQ